MKIHELFNVVIGKFGTKDSDTYRDTVEENESGTFRMAKLRLASHPHTSSETLAKLAGKESPELLERVAENPQASPETLRELAVNEDPSVRIAVAENQNTPTDAIETLAGDENVDVRFRLAENPHAPLEVLYVLAVDINPYVADRARRTLKNLCA